MIRPENQPPTLEREKKLLIDFISKTDALSRYYRDLQHLPAHMLIIPDIEAIKDHTVSKDPDEYKDFVITGGNKLVDDSRHYINLRLTMIGGLTCSTVLPGRDNEELFTLGKWHDNDDHGRMLWSLKESEPDVRIPFLGSKLVSELYTLNT